MRRKVIMLPCISAVILIAAFALMGACKDQGIETVEDLLRQRTAVMNDMLYDRITEDEGEKKLKEVEDGELLRNDMKNIRLFDDTDMESVENIEVISLEKKGRVYDTLSYKAEIKWDIAGRDGLYSSTDIYSIGVLQSENNYKLISLELQQKE